MKPTILSQLKYIHCIPEIASEFCVEGSPQPTNNMQHAPSMRNTRVQTSRDKGHHKMIMSKQIKYYQTQMLIMVITPAAQRMVTTGFRARNIYEWALKPERRLFSEVPSMS